MFRKTASPAVSQRGSLGKACHDLGETLHGPLVKRARVEFLAGRPGGMLDGLFWLHRGVHRWLLRDAFQWAPGVELSISGWGGRELLKTAVCDRSGSTSEGK